jgi:hypothetical protein
MPAVDHDPDPSTDITIGSGVPADVSFNEVFVG